MCIAQHELIHPEQFQERLFLSICSWGRTFRDSLPGPWLLMQKNSRHLIWHTFKSRRSFPYEAYQISTWFILNAYLACFLILPKSHFWVLARQESRFCRTLIKDEGIMQRLHIRQMHSGRILNKSVWGLMGKGKFLVQSSCISCLTSSICTDPYSWLGKVTLRFNITASTWH